MSILEDWKIVFDQWQPPPRANPVIGETGIAPPLVGFTQTFISVVGFKTEVEAANCNKYINTKFVKALLSVLKVTQHNPPATWKYVPIQDFTNNSDIDWSKPIADIDRQLYKKYQLDDEMIKFIEDHIAYHKSFQGR